MNAPDFRSVDQHTGKVTPRFDDDFPEVELEYQRERVAELQTRLDELSAENEELKQTLRDTLTTIQHILDVSEEQSTP